MGNSFCPIIKECCNIECVFCNPDADTETKKCTLAHAVEIFIQYDDTPPSAHMENITDILKNIAGRV